MVADLSRRRAEAAALVDVCRKRVAEEEGRIAEARKSVEVLKARHTSESQLVSLLERDVRRLEAEADTLKARVRAEGEERERVEAAREEAAARLTQLERVHAEQARALDDVRGRRPREEDLRERLRTARAQASEAVGAHERGTARYEELQAERMRLSAEIVREMGTQPDALPSVEDDGVPSEDELRRLRSRAMQHAELDTAVVEEYRELQARGEYLTSQVADLRAAADGLREIMTVADREMRTRFQTALASVNREFDHVFRVMLRGGEASLEQVDDDGAIEVRATLPGRRARSSAAFSGGERALVASSLLFAVLRIRPTPFCVLDEVDAALDETNVDRYLAALREISARTQVIVVTHNRATMAAANALYGLTMDAEGASSVLSLRLDAYEEAG
jgi:chromosome segregation protein